MSSSLLSLAVATDGVTQITEKFGINLPGILSQAVSFAFVAFILWRFGFKPVLATLDERQKKIASGLQYAEEMKAKLEASQVATAAQLKEAQLKAQQIIADAQKAAKELADKQQAEATARAGDAVAKAQAAIELEKNKMLAEARTEIARLVVATAERVLARELSEHDRERYNASAARELSSV